VRSADNTFELKHPVSGGFPESGKCELRFEIVHLVLSRRLTSHAGLGYTLAELGSSRSRKRETRALPVLMSPALDALPGIWSR